MSTSFEPRFGLIIVDVLLTGPTANGRLRMALDTGATFSMINKSVLATCGYIFEQESEYVEVTTASGIEMAPRIKVQAISALGMQ
jgi:predicted aspartyl protease